MVKYITLQGNIKQEGTKLWTAKTDGTFLTKIIINNSVNTPYKIQIYKYLSTSGLDTIKLYSFELNAGDVFTDTSNYILNKEDYILVKTDVNTVNFIIEGNDTNN